MMNISLNDPFIKICAFSSVFETIGRPMVFIASLSKNKTQIVLDTGAGANCINPKFLEDKNVQLLSEYLFPKSLKIQVGNLQTTNITKAVLVEMKTTNNKALFWFLVVEHLPIWRRSLEIACQQRTSFRCKRNKGIYYQKFRCNQEGGG